MNSDQLDIKILALDLDQTLLTNDKRISKENKFWIRKAIEAGITVMFCTGRGVQTSEDYMRELNLDSSPMVLVNGGEVWKSHGELLERHLLPRDDVRRLVAFAQKNQVNFWGYSVESHTLGHKWTENMFQRDWIKFGMRSNDAGLIEQMRDEVKNWGTFEVTYADPLNIEISALGVSKASGIKAVCQHLQIDLKAVMAVGDSHNDLDMLKTVGLGVAMGNATEQVKAAADVITASNEENGVAQAIQRFIFQSCE